MVHEPYIQRCIDLAGRGLGQTAPNPLVGSIIVNNGIIIGEGYHEIYGGPHAEVNAIHSVQDQKLLETSTLYVNLEPCVHYGKTPPCALLIIEKKIPRVVIGSIDPFLEVAGKGIELLKSSGIEVIVGVLQQECIHLNRRFYAYMQEDRPYIILKWAQTNDEYIGYLNQTEGDSLKITNPKTNILVHQWRSEEQAILVGKNTILKDNPQLNVRLIEGRQPQPIVLALKDSIPAHYKIHENNPVFFGNKTTFLKELIVYCKEHRIQSILVEGGASVLNYFIKENLWDEARVITNKQMVAGCGLKAPSLNLTNIEHWMIGNDEIKIIYNNHK